MFAARKPGSFSRFGHSGLPNLRHWEKLSENVLPDAAAIFCSISCGEIIGINDLWQICVIFVPQPRPLETN